MSNANPNPDQQKAVLDQAYNNAYSTLVDQVWAPVFFQKLANDWGISPRNDAEAQKMITLAHRLRAGYQNELQKQSGERGSILDKVLEDVGAVLSEDGVGSNSDEDFIGEAQKVAEAVVQQNPHLRDAALLYQDFLNQSLNQ